MNNAQRYCNLITVDPASVEDGVFDSSIVFIDELKLKEYIPSSEITDSEDVFSWVQKSNMAYLHVFDDNSLLLLGITGEDPIISWQFICTLDQLMTEPKRLQQMIAMSDYLKDFFKYALRELTTALETVKSATNLTEY